MIYDDTLILGSCDPKVNENLFKLCKKVFNDGFGYDVSTKDFVADDLHEPYLRRAIGCRLGFSRLYKSIDKRRPEEFFALKGTAKINGAIPMHELEAKSLEDVLATHLEGLFEEVKDVANRHLLKDCIRMGELFKADEINFGFERGFEVMSNIDKILAGYKTKAESELMHVDSDSCVFICKKDVLKDISKYTAIDDESENITILGDTNVYTADFDDDFRSIFIARGSVAQCIYCVPMSIDLTEDGLFVEIQILWGNAVLRRDFITLN